MVKGPKDQAVSERLPVARVAVDISLAHLDRPSDYLEPDPHPAAGHGRLVHAGRNEVVKGAVEMGQGDIHGDPGDGQPLAHHLILRPL